MAWIGSRGVESLPKTGEADVDQDVCTASGNEENAERRDCRGEGEK